MIQFSGHNGGGEDVERAEIIADPFPAAVRASRMPMIITDPNKSENPIVFANEAFSELTGYSTQEVLGRNCRFLQGPGTDPRHVDMIRSAIVSNIPTEIEILNYKKNGEEFWNRLLISPVFGADGKLEYFFASQYDNSNQRATQKALEKKTNEFETLVSRLQENERQLNALIRSSSDVRYSINADWTELYELAGGNFLADTLTTNRAWLEQYIPVQDHDAVRTEIERAVRTKSTYVIEHRVNRIDGTIGHALFRAVPLLDRDGQIIKWLGAASDVTERKLADVAIRESEANLRELSEFREQFIAVLGHDLRNPVAAVDSGATMLLREGWTDRSPKLLRLMRGSVTRMHGLIDNVLDLARARLGDGIALDITSDIPLQPTLEQVVDEIKAAYPDRLILTEFDIPDALSLDHLRIAQMFSNLLGNAVTHGAEDLPIRVAALIKTGHFHLEISNGGEPILAAAMERLFQPFYRDEVRPNVQGLGLGLYIASQIAEAHGGRLDVKSDEKETRFTFRMPIT